MSAPTTEKPAKRKYRLMQGFHSEVIGYDKDGRPQSKMFKPGDIVESGTDLIKRYNRPGSQKFARIYREDEEEAAALAAGVHKNEQDNLEVLTLRQLQMLAENEALDLGDVKSNKADFIVAIRRAREAKR